jgi:hypothetical protein
MPELEKLHQRLERLEACMTEADADLGRLHRQYQPFPPTLRIAAIGLALLLLLTLGAAPAKETRVQAPFRVVDSNNKAIFAVNEEHSIGVYRAEQQDVPALIASAPAQGHAFFKVQSPGQNQVAVMGVVAGKTPEMELRQNGITKVILAAEGGKPSLELTNGKIPLLQLGQGERGAGRLQIEDAGGRIMVQAGTTQNGVGAVSTYTDAPPGGQIYRVPNSFICGTGCGK